MKETDLQRRAVEAINQHGGHAFKAANRFLVGVADLSIKLPQLPHAFCEVKLEDWPVKKDWISIETTVLQRKFLRTYRQAGGLSLVAIFAKRGTKWMLFLTHLTDQVQAPLTEFKELGPWHDTKGLCRLFQEAVLAARAFQDQG